MKKIPVVVKPYEVLPDTTDIEIAESQNESLLARAVDITHKYVVDILPSLLERQREFAMFAEDERVAQRAGQFLIELVVAPQKQDKTPAVNNFFSGADLVALLRGDRVHPIPTQAREAPQEGK